MDSLVNMITAEEVPARSLEMVNEPSSLFGEQVPDPSSLMFVVVIATICMVFMAWGIGANDVANSFATAFGARCLTARQACVIAAFCEMGGCIFLGGHVSDTIRKGMMSASLYDGDEGRVLLMAGMTAVLLAASCWLAVASRYGLPVSTTHSAVGGVIAFACASKGYDSVKWSKVGMIVASWFISPTMAGVAGFMMYFLIKKLVLQRSDSLRRAKIASPVMVFLMTFTVAMFTIYKGAKGIGLNKTSPEVAVGASVATAAIVAGISYPIMAWHARTLEAAEVAAQAAKEQGAASPPEPEPKPSEEPRRPSRQHMDELQDDNTFIQEVIKSTSAPSLNMDEEQAEVAPPVQSKTEQMFRALVVVIAAFQSVAHGANDVANSVGPFGAVLGAKDGPIQKKTEIPIWVFLVAGSFIVLGLLTYGMHVMKTIGKNITEVTPSKACCAQFAATLVVLVATRLGLPISTTHAAVGGVLGVGLADGINAIDWRVMAKVFLSWIITLPICGLSAAGTYALFLPLVVAV